MSSIVNNPAPVVNDNPILNRRSMISIGVMLVIWASLLFYALLKVWPRDHPDGRPIYFFSKIPFLQFQLESGSLDQRLIALVVIVGALGSFIHSATSFADYVGNRKFVESWTWWYLLRPFVGSALALALYFVVRARLLGLRGGAGADVQNAEYPRVGGYNLPGHACLQVRNHHLYVRHDGAGVVDHGPLNAASELREEARRKKEKRGNQCARTGHGSFPLCILDNRRASYGFGLA